MLRYWVQSVTSVIDSKQTRIHNFWGTIKSGREVVFIAMGTQRPFTEKLECKFRLHFRGRVLDPFFPPFPKVNCMTEISLVRIRKIFPESGRRGRGEFKMQWKDPETILFFVHVILLCDFYNLDFFFGGRGGSSSSAHGFLKILCK